MVSNLAEWHIMLCQNNNYQFLRLYNTLIISEFEELDTHKNKKKGLGRNNLVLKCPFIIFVSIFCLCIRKIQILESNTFLTWKWSISSNILIVSMQKPFTLSFGSPLTSVNVNKCAISERDAQLNSNWTKQTSSPKGNDPSPESNVPRSNLTSNKLAWRHHFPIITLWNIFQTLKGH